MSQEFSPPPQVLHLAAGSQAVINGALVSARENCTLEVAAGAYVQTGRALWPAGEALRAPRDELYFSILDCGLDDERFEAERLRLFSLLGEVIAQDRGYETQRECSVCAAALMTGDAKAALESAARMVSTRSEAGAKRAGQTGDRPDRRRARPDGI